MTEQQQQGEVLAVHTAQLTNANLAQLAQQGYGILPDQSGWLIFARVPPPSPALSRQSSDGAAEGAPTADSGILSPDAQHRAPDGLDAPDVGTGQRV